MAGDESRECLGGSNRGICRQSLGEETESSRLGSTQNTPLAGLSIKHVMRVNRQVEMWNARNRKPAKMRSIMTMVRVENSFERSRGNRSVVLYTKERGECIFRMSNPVEREEK